ncbi:MAG: D-2-hydroxyacid dehydrogenase [Pseudomonadales bacterium]
MSRMTQLLSAVLIVLCVATPSQAKSKTDAATQSLIDELGLRESKQAIRKSASWQKPKRVVVFLPGGQLASPSQAMEQLQQVSNGVELVPVAEFSKLPAALQGADVLLGFCTPQVLQAGTQLRWVQSYSAGVDRCVGAAQLQDNNLLLTNMQRVHGPAIAEHVLAMLFSLARDLPRYQQLQSQETWERTQQGTRESIEIRGKTMLIVGLGGIGTEIAKRAHALGMRIIATRNSSREGPEYVDRVGLADELPELIKQADVVVNATPLTPATTGMFDATVFDAMRSDAYFINIGRGASVVTDDLTMALKEGDIAAAALDVTDPEPLPKDNELWGLPNVLITPHISARSDQSIRRVWLLVRENLRRYVRGERMLNVVDIKRGY